jgi:hypothetical protein
MVRTFRVESCNFEKATISGKRGDNGDEVTQFSLQNDSHRFISDGSTIQPIDGNVVYLLDLRFELRDSRKTVCGCRMFSNKGTRQITSPCRRRLPNHQVHTVASDRCHRNGRVQHRARGRYLWYRY